MRYLKVTLVATVVAVAGCAESDTVLFVTGTDLGIQFDGATQNASVGYDRSELVIAPVFRDGAVPPVFGQFETDRSIFTPHIVQLHATGNAALVATKRLKQPSIADGTTPLQNKLNKKRRMMFFGTATSTGLKVTLGTPRPANFNFGFKRQEVSLIPLTDVVKQVAEKDLDGSTKNKLKVTGKRYAPVIGSLRLRVRTKEMKDAGMFIQQFFATGDAAEMIAGYDEVSKSIIESTERAIAAANGAVDAQSVADGQGVEIRAAHASALPLEVDQPAPPSVPLVPVSDETLPAPGASQ